MAKKSEPKPAILLFADSIQVDALPYVEAPKYVMDPQTKKPKNRIKPLDMSRTFNVVNGAGKEIGSIWLRIQASCDPELFEDILDLEGDECYAVDLSSTATRADVPTYVPTRSAPTREEVAAEKESKTTGRGRRGARA